MNAKIQTKTIFWRWKRFTLWFRQWLLEDQANQGLGGPPNNWQHSPHYLTRQHGMSTGHRWFCISFGNDAFDVHVSTQYTDEDQSKYLFMIAAEDFRKLAFWYLWRWIWGEWFGLRRKIYYWDLNRRYGNKGKS